MLKPWICTKCTCTCTVHVYAINRGHHIHHHHHQWVPMASFLFQEGYIRVADFESSASKLLCLSWIWNIVSRTVLGRNVKLHFFSSLDSTQQDCSLLHRLQFRWDALASNCFVTESRGCSYRFFSSSLLSPQCCGTWLILLHGHHWNKGGFDISRNITIIT